MAEVTITAANVHLQGAARVMRATFAETMTNGQACYKNITTGKWSKADANTDHSADTLAMVLVGAAGDAQGVIVTEGPMDVGGTLSNGIAYVVGETAGSIAPATDFSGFTSGFQYHIGYATAADILFVKPYSTGAVT